MLDVDWDKIDKQYYKEVEPPHEFVQRNSTLEERLPEPSTIASVITPDVTLTSDLSHKRVMQVVKPDGDV